MRTPKWGPVEGIGLGALETDPQRVASGGRQERATPGGEQPDSSGRSPFHAHAHPGAGARGLVRTPAALTCTGSRGAACSRRCARESGCRAWALGPPLPREGTGWTPGPPRARPCAASPSRLTRDAGRPYFSSEGTCRRTQRGN